MNNFGFKSSNCCSSKPYSCSNYSNNYNDTRFGGGFLFPFLAGAAISAPFWYLGANKNQQQAYYPPQPYPMYYPYPANQTDSFPSYYPYPMYR